jgi:hypothetical protein
MCCHSIFVVRGGKTLWDSQMNATTVWRKLCYAKEGIPMGEKVPRFQNKHCWSGHLTTSGVTDIVEQANTLVWNNRWITVTNIADKLDISCGSGIRYHKICVWWVPNQLTDEHKWAHVKTRTQFFQQYCEEREVCNGLSQWWNMDAPLWTCKQTWNHEVEAHIMTQDQKIQNCAFCQQSDDTVLEL